MLLYLPLVGDPRSYIWRNLIHSLSVRNSDLAGITSTIIQLERKFNEHFRYPYVFLNDVPFEQTFKEWSIPTTQSRLSGLIDPKNHSRVTKLTKSKVEFGLIPAEHWNQPQWINETKASLARQRLLKDGVAYGGEFAMLILCSVKLFTVELHRESFVRLSWSGSNFGYSYINPRYRNMCRFFAGVMFPFRTISSAALNISKSNLGTVLV